MCRKDKNKKLLFYVPRSMEANVIRTCHDDLGHVGIDKAINNIAKVYWFPRMRDKVREYISNCLRCVEFLRRAEGRKDTCIAYLKKICLSRRFMWTIWVLWKKPVEVTVTCLLSSTLSLNSSGSIHVSRQRRRNR